MNKFSVQKSAQFLNLNPQQFRNLVKTGKLGIEPIGYYKTKYGKKASLFSMEQLVELDSHEEVKKARARKKVDTTAEEQENSEDNQLRKVKVVVLNGEGFQEKGELTTREIWENWGIENISYNCEELTVVGG